MVLMQIETAKEAKEAKDFIYREFGIDWHLHWVQKLLKKNFAVHLRRSGESQGMRQMKPSKHHL